MILKNKLTEYANNGLASNVDTLIDDRLDKLNCVRVGIVEEYYPEDYEELDFEEEEDDE